MGARDPRRRLTLSGSAQYEIWVQGHVAAHWSEALGMAITWTRNEQGVVSYLRGQLADQAALNGVLQRLYGLGYPLIKVRHCVEESQPPAGAPPASSGAEGEVGDGGKHNKE